MSSQRLYTESLEELLLGVLEKQSHLGGSPVGIPIGLDTHWWGCLQYMMASGSGDRPRCLPAFGREVAASGTWALDTGCRALQRPQVWELTGMPGGTQGASEHLSHTCVTLVTSQAAGFA